MEKDELDHAMKKYDEADEKTRRKMYQQHLVSSEHWFRILSLKSDRQNELEDTVRALTEQLTGKQEWAPSDLTEVPAEGGYSVLVPEPTRPRKVTLFGILTERRAPRTTGGDRITMRNIRANGLVIGKYEISEKEVEL